jgi:hypothetical protein
MAVTDIKEKANEVRKERASSLKGFFNNCFVPTKHVDENTIEGGMYIENDIHSGNDIGIENTIYIENATHSENDMYSENDTRESTTCSENTIHTGNTVKLAKSLGFTALGALAVLIDEFPGGVGMLNVTQLSKSCGVARTTLIAQLRCLEKCGVISLGSSEKHGRWLKILCSENTTCSENAIPAPCSSSSSSILNNKNNYYNNYYYGEETCIENTTLENATYSENTIRKNDMYSKNDTRENTTYLENATLNERLSKSIITLRVAARELYFTAKASLTSIDRLSNQCFQQFLSVKQAKGANYAMALFLGLLTKSKENPTAYVIRAIQQGAAPSQEDQRRAESISKAAETVFKKIGEEILQRDLDLALHLVSLENFSQGQIQEELNLFTKRISE